MMDINDYLVFGTVTLGCAGYFGNEFSKLNESIQEINKNQAAIARNIDTELEKRLKIEDINSDGIPDFYVVIGEKKVFCYGTSK